MDSGVTKQMDLEFNCKSCHKQDYLSPGHRQLFQFQDSIFDNAVHCNVNGVHI
jgi:hypothetical protein